MLTTISAQVFDPVKTTLRNLYVKRLARSWHFMMHGRRKLSHNRFANVDVIFSVVFTFLSDMYAALLASLSTHTHTHTHIHTTAMCRAIC